MKTQRKTIRTLRKELRSVSTELVKVQTALAKAQSELKTMQVLYNIRLKEYDVLQKRLDEVVAENVRKDTKINNLKSALHHASNAFTAMCRIV